MQDQTSRSTETKFPKDFDALMGERLAAEYLGVTPRALQKWRVSGSGPEYVRISSRCIRYRQRDLVSFVEGRLVSSTSEYEIPEKIK